MSEVNRTKLHQIAVAKNFEKIGPRWATPRLEAVAAQPCQRGLRSVTPITPGYARLRLMTPNYACKK